MAIFQKENHKGRSPSDFPEGILPLSPSLVGIMCFYPPLHKIWDFILPSSAMDIVQWHRSRKNYGNFLSLCLIVKSALIYNNGRLLHLQPKGSWAFPAPRECCCCPRAVDRRSKPEGSSNTPEGSEYAHEPEGWGVIMTFSYIGQFWQ